MLKPKLWMMPPAATPNLPENPVQADFESFPEEHTFARYLDNLLTLLHSPGGNGLARHSNRR